MISVFLEQASSHEKFHALRHGMESIHEAFQWLINEKKNETETRKFFMQGVSFYTTPFHLRPSSKTQSHGQVEVPSAEEDGVNCGGDRS